MIIWLRPARKVSNMDGFKDSTRMKYMTGGPAKRAEAKMGKVMGEFASGKLHSGSKKGPEVKNPKQAVAIAMSEARKAAAKKPVKMALGGTFNEKGKRATLAEMEAEDRRMGSSMPAKKPVGPSSSAVSKVLAGMAKKALPAGGIGGAAAGAAAGALAGAAARAAKAVPRGMGAMSDREMQMVREAARKAVPSYSDRPMIRRNMGGLTTMPKGKC